MTIVAKRRIIIERFSSHEERLPYQHRLLILHFDLIKVPKINSRFVHNVHLLIELMICIESSMALVLTSQPKIHNRVMRSNEKSISPNLFL